MGNGKIKFTGICDYKNFGSNRVVYEEGRNIKDLYVEGQLDKCKEACDISDGCKSFAICRAKSGNCHLKDKLLNGSEESYVKAEFRCTTYYRHCGNHFHELISI